MKAYAKHCTNCENFAWWDGDYCCMYKCTILQPSLDGDFTDIIPTTHCSKYRYSRKVNDDYGSVYREFLKK